MKQLLCLVFFGMNFLFYGQTNSNSNSNSTATPAQEPVHKEQISNGSRIEKRITRNKPTPPPIPKKKEEETTTKKL
jgi:hypothetical protein